MYVTPDPSAAEDPLFAVRLAFISAATYLVVAVMGPAMPPIVATFPIGLLGGMRKRYSPKTGLGGPVLLAWLMTAVVEHLRPMPMVYVGSMWLLFFLGFKMVLRTGSQLGMLVILITVLVSIMGMNGSAAVELLRGGLFEAAALAALIGVGAHALFPARTTEVHAPHPMPSRGNLDVGAAIRATVLLLLCLWLYTVMLPGDMMLAVIATMVLVFPSRAAMFSEAGQRIRATVYGLATGLVILQLFTVLGTLPLLLAMIFLMALFYGDRMMHGPHPANVYLYAISVAMSLISGGLSTQDAGYAALTRIVLTLGGALAAALAVSLLDSILRWRED